jgi:hypothetical protein
MPILRVTNLMRDSSTAWPRGRKTAEEMRGHFAQNDTA